jgi:hypothetical protein
MRLNLEFKEDIHMLLAKAAREPTESAEQILLLNEAGTLLWRFDDSLLPRNAEDIRPLLETDINEWMPEQIGLFYTGPLISNGSPTMLADTILMDLCGDSLNMRDELLTLALSPARESPRPPHSFREFANQFGFPGTIGLNEISPESLEYPFYTELAPYQRGDYIYSCPSCQMPLDQNQKHFQCSSPFCPTTTYPILPPHESVPYHARKLPLIKTAYDKQLKLTHLAWRTIASPLLMEKTILTFLKKVVPTNLHETITTNDSRPGITIIEGGWKINIEPVATHSASSVQKYYAQQHDSDETWLIIPSGTTTLFRHLPPMLPENFRFLTPRSYPDEYLSKFHSNLKTGKRFYWR